MQIATSSQGPWTVLTLAGKVDNPGSDELDAALAPHLTGGLLALDFTEVVYVTSSGFRVLLSALKQQNARGGKILLGGLNDAVQNYFNIGGLTQVFEIVPALAPVLASRAGPGNPQ